MLAAMKHVMPLIALTLLAGCGSAPSDRTAGGVTPDEARALDDAAEMIEARRLPAEALRAPVAPQAPLSGAGAASAAAGEPKR